jgi:hypothetical protein
VQEDLDTALGSGAFGRVTHHARPPLGGGA